ncbi:rCG24220, isoform CRA_b [Rattus norvegicus]|uniref:RCG24220, isoform CRA_b n=1 Tax=Rattus norvegicus TaxID=10116 RepID=A6KAF8_RAT|nr:rCG24220, isoform CRA_b [Rattus norvegicus]
MFPVVFLSRFVLPHKSQHFHWLSKIVTLICWKTGRFVNLQVGKEIWSRNSLPQFSSLAIWSQCL